MQVLGSCPELAVVMAYAASVTSVDGGVSLGELSAEISRLLIYSGKVVTEYERVGHIAQVAARARVPREQFEPGYCYECLIRPHYRAKARSLLGAYPTLRRLVSKDVAAWCIDDALDVIRVTQGKIVDVSGVATVVLHFALGGDGAPLRTYVQSVEALSTLRLEAGCLRVGQAGVCYSSTWYVMAIIAWTIVGSCLLGVLIWMWYGRCVGGRGGGGGRRY